MEPFQLVHAVEMARYHPPCTHTFSCPPEAPDDPSVLPDLSSTLGIPRRDRPVGKGVQASRPPGGTAGTLALNRCPSPAAPQKLRRHDWESPKSSEVCPFPAEQPWTCGWGLPGLPSYVGTTLSPGGGEEQAVAQSSPSCSEV